MLVLTTATATCASIPTNPSRSTSSGSRRPAPRLVLTACAVRSGSRAPLGPRTQRIALQTRQRPELVSALLPHPLPVGEGGGEGLHGRCCTMLRVHRADSAPLARHAAARACRSWW